MAKTAIRWLPAGRRIAFAGALVCANGSLVMHGLDVTGIRETTFSLVMAGLAVVAILVLVTTAITQFTAWAGAVIDAARRNDKAWFIILLVTGLASFGFIVMLIYVMAVT